MVSRGAEYCYENAEQIHFHQQVYEEMSSNLFNFGLLTQLMRYKDPLRVARERWDFENNVDISEEIEYALESFFVDDDAMGMYELDDDTAQPEQGQQMA